MNEEDSKLKGLPLKVQWYFAVNQEDIDLFNNDLSYKELRLLRIKHDHDLEDEEIHILNANELKTSIYLVKNSVSIDIGMFIISNNIKNIKWHEEMKKIARRNSCNLFTETNWKEQEIDNLPKSLRDAIQDKPITD